MTRTVVVGGGASGVPLAVRLSEDPGREVVLIEAGPAPRPYPAELLDGTTVQAAMPGHVYNWSYQGYLTSKLPYTIARGRVLGGSSAINGGYFVHARPGDFARWAQAAGPEWTYERVHQDLAEGQDDTDAAEVFGRMPVSRPAQESVLARAFTAAAHELGFPFEADKNAPGAPGVGPVPSNVIDGIRVNTALAYLHEAEGPSNLQIMSDTRALRIRFHGMRAVGVETDRGVVDADEVVLAAGAIGTPHLLLVSGVGPRAQLEGHGIEVVSDLPVGESFSDHPDLAVGWRPRKKVVSRDERAAFPTVLNFDSSGSGAFPEGDMEILLSVKPLGYLLAGERGGLRGGMRQLVRHPLRTVRALWGTSARRAASEIAHAGDMQLIVGLQRPVGRGSITLIDADPFTPPRIDYRYLEEEVDLSRMRTGIRTAVALLRSRAFAGLFDTLTQLDDQILDDDALLNAWMRKHLGTAIHLCGSVPMGSVLDEGGRVRGASGLRVADTSMLPDVPSRGPFATAVLIGELMGRRIRRGG